MVTVFCKFSKAILEDNPGMGFLDIARETGVRWKALSEEDKQPYTAMAAEDKLRNVSEVSY